MEIWILLGLFMLLLFLKVPVAFSMGIASLVYIVVASPDVPLTLISQRMIAGSTGFVIIAVPFFILAAEIMNAGSVTDRLFNFASVIVGRTRGGHAQANVMASMVFAGISGSALADAAGLGVIEIKAMKDKGYSSEFSAAVSAASSIIGPIIPPSTALIFFGISAQVPIGNLFAAGILPGILMGIMMMILIYFIARWKKFPRHVISSKQSLKYSKEAFLSMLTPVIIVGGILGGVFTPTEASCVAVVYALILAVVVYREVRIQDLPRLFTKTAKLTGMILFLIGSSTLYAWVISFAGIPVLIKGLFLGVTESPILGLLLLNLLLLIVGCFMETIASILILTPILLPVAVQFGLTPTQFGVVMVVNLCIGLLTPPMAVVLYVTARIADAPVYKVVKALLPFYAVLIGALLLITYISWFTMYIPGLIYG